MYRLKQKCKRNCISTSAHLVLLGVVLTLLLICLPPLQDFKREVDPHMVEVESLNRQAKELSEQTSSEQARALRQPLDEINRRWTALLRGLVDRQRELENALLRLGQFQHALGELLVWMARTERALDECRPVAGDAQVIEVELAKHKVGLCRCFPPRPQLLCFIYNAVSHLVFYMRFQVFS